MQIFVQFFLVHLFYFSIPITSFRTSLYRVKNESIYASLIETQSSPLKGLRTRYEMNLFVGTPSVAMSAMIDTGSSLIWLKCGRSKEEGIFNPKKSSTLMYEKCRPRNKCPLISAQNVFCNNDHICSFKLAYLDETEIRGEIATDIVKVATRDGQPILSNNIQFGCTKVAPDGETGLVGLGLGGDSLVGQLGRYISWQFAYCMVPPLYTRDEPPGIISFGENKEPDDSTVVLPLGYGSKTEYEANLRGFTIGGQKVKYSDEGVKTVIDSGSTLTLVPKDFYEMIEPVILNMTAGKPIKRDIPEYYNLCYQDDEQFVPPSFVANFWGRRRETRSLQYLLSGTNPIAKPGAKPSVFWYNNRDNNYKLGYLRQPSSNKFFSGV